MAISYRNGDPAKETARGREMTLDDKLREILLGPTSTDEAVELVKKAFTGEGYVQVPNVSISKEGWIEVSTDRGVRHNGTPLMTGQEWFTTFTKELKKARKFSSDVDQVYVAAKRASGLENK